MHHVTASYYSKSTSSMNRYVNVREKRIDAEGFCARQTQMKLPYYEFEAYREHTFADRMPLQSKRNFQLSRLQ